MNKTKIQEPLVNAEVLSRETGLSVPEIHDLRRRRAIPCINLGHRTKRFVLSDVQAALAKLEVRAV